MTIIPTITKKNPSNEDRRWDRTDGLYLLINVTLPREVKPVRRVCLSAPLIIQRVSHEIDIIYSFTFPAAVLVF